MLEELKNMRWTWHQETGTPCIFIYHYLYFWETGTNQIYKTTSQYITLHYRGLILSLTHWYLRQKTNVPLLLHRDVLYIISLIDYWKVKCYVFLDSPISRFCFVLKISIVFIFIWLHSQTLKMLINREMIEKHKIQRTTTHPDDQDHI